MRESRKTERMRLGDAYEEWLKRQSSGQKSSKHQKPPADLYETWVEKRVVKILETAARARPAAG